MGKIRFILLVNKQGQTRMSQYYTDQVVVGAKRNIMEADIVRKCLARSENMCAFLPYDHYKVIYRQYASLFFIVGVDNDVNELSILEFIHAFVTILDKFFENVCELDIMFNLEKVHYILQEMVMDGTIVDTNELNVLRPLRLIDAYLE
mmetsp:Transcript_20768/g.58437  ORF Transcript_20768/g.58437 Transcript_20768/m.58437 type:complete len:148 (+) Transcript_20768:37-480(+)